MKIITCACEPPARGKREEREVPKETETPFGQLQNGQEAQEKTSHTGTENEEVHGSDSTLTSRASGTKAPEPQSNGV